MTISKRKKSNRRAVTIEKEEAGEDIISSFPEFLLIHILSLLNDTKQAVKTCVLSKRWQFVWTHLLEINIRETSFESKKIRRFVDFVGRMIAMCRCLNKFAVEFDCQEQFASNLNHWINFAIENKVKDITLLFYYTEESYYKLPQFLYSYSSLLKLKVRYCVMAPLGVTAWKSLESLTVERMELLDSVMENILSNCPLLKILHLQWCTGLNYLNIKSPNLTTLVINSPEWSWNNGNILGLDISAPSLPELTIFCNPLIKQVRLTNVSSVVQANIEFSGSEEISSMNNMKQFLESLRSVEILELGTQCLKIISVLKVESWIFPSYTKLWSLTLTIFSHEVSIPGILANLRFSPNLRTLRIKGTQTTGSMKIGLDDYLKRYRIHVKDCNMELVASHLKIVEIDKNIEVEHMLTLVQILLNCTNVLEKMIISLDAPSSSASIDSMEIADRLLTFPRASPAAVIVLR